MGIFDRLARLVKSNVNDAIEKAEDPEKMLKQLMEELNNDLMQVKTQVAAAIASEKQLAMKQRQFAEEAEKWGQKAQLAVDKGEDDLAREALARRNTARQTADGFQAQWEDARKQVSMLKDSMSKLESKIAEANTKKDLLVARHRRAKAEEKIQKTLSRSGGSSALSAFERMEGKVMEGESRAAAYGELNSSSLEDRFASLGSGSADVEDELAQLKAAKDQKALPAGE